MRGTSGGVDETENGDSDVVVVVDVVLFAIVEDATETVGVDGTGDGDLDVVGVDIV